MEHSSEIPDSIPGMVHCVKVVSVALCLSIVDRYVNEDEIRDSDMVAGMNVDSVDVSALENTKDAERQLKITGCSHLSQIKDLVCYEFANLRLPSGRLWAVHDMMNGDGYPMTMNRTWVKNNLKPENIPSYSDFEELYRVCEREIKDQHILIFRNPKTGATVRFDMDVRLGYRIEFTGKRTYRRGPYSVGNGYGLPVLAVVV